MVTCILDKDNGFNISNRRAHTHQANHLNKNSKTSFDIWAMNMADARAEGKLNDETKGNPDLTLKDLPLIEKLKAESIMYQGHKIDMYEGDKANVPVYQGHEVL